MESPLRDLARKLRATAREHFAYSQVADFMRHVDEHLSALARCEESNAAEVTADRNDGQVAKHISETALWDVLGRVANNHLDREDAEDFFSELRMRLAEVSE